MLVNKIKSKETVPYINIEELHNTRDNKIKQKIGAFKEVLRLCHQKIKKTSKNTTEFYCFYVIPPMVYGYPLFDVNSCILYVVEKLVANGFQVMYTHPNLLFISWYQKPTPAPQPLPIPQSSPEISFRKPTDYHPARNFIQSNTQQSNQQPKQQFNNMEELKNKANRLLYDSL